MIPVPSDHLPDISEDPFLKNSIVIKKLPAWNGVKNHQAEGITNIVNSRIIRIVRQPDKVHSRFLDPFQIPVLVPVGQRVTDKGPVLMTVRSDKSKWFTI
jgi:hypothetical protein